MIKVSYDEIIERIKKEANLTEQEIEERIQKKLKQLSGLISREGAAHIIANELNVKVFSDITKKKYKINEIPVGLRNIGISGKVIKNYGVREFSTERRSGKVGSLLVGDETGTIRLVFWDDSLTNQINDIKENDIVKVKGGYVRENQGFKEIHLGNNSSLSINPEGEVIENVVVREKRELFKKKISELSENEFVEVIGTVVQIFEPRFYNACPECNKKVSLDGEKYNCLAHGHVMAKKIPIVNLYFDDGSENIRVVLFRELVPQFLGLSEDALLNLNPDQFEELRNKILGKQVKIAGRVSKNDMFSRLEFNASFISELDPLQLAKELEKEISS